MEEQLFIHRDFFNSARLRLIISLVIAVAFLFGFMDLFIPYDFERLHIFLFNLTSGGFIILYYSEHKPYPSRKTIVFFLLSILFAILAFMEVYIAASIIPLLLTVITERVRTDTFSFFPVDLFRNRTPLSKKFHHASLLCLSLALLLSSIVIINNTLLQWFYFKKLTLNVFFLGFSFPVSLITMSLMFSFIEDKNNTERNSTVVHVLFWVINGGVILFFVFIIYKLFIAELIIASILFLSVIFIFILFIRNRTRKPQTLFLTSGMLFLLSTGITGVLYIITKKFLNYNDISTFLIKTHSYAALYGWNLGGLLFLITWHNALSGRKALFYIIFQWIIVLLLAPAAHGNTYMAVITSALFTLFIFAILKRKDSI